MNNNNELKSIVKVDASVLPCNITDTCTYKERTLSFAVGVDVTPVPVIDTVKLFKECCYLHYVYAHAMDNDEYKNDYSAFYHQREINTETVNFELIQVSTGARFDLNNNTYGQYFGFGSQKTNLDFTGYRVDWQKVLNSLGPGAYQVATTSNKVGIVFERLSYTFNLLNYSTELVDRTTRIDIVMNGYLQSNNVDFTGINWRHSVRVKGFFGRRSPSFEERNIIDRRFDNKQVSIQQTNEYKFQTNFIPECITSEIFDFVLMANDIYINDYNLNNHNYKIKSKGVKVATLEEPTYNNTSKMAQLNIVFNDKILNKIKRNYR
ncbi:MAG: hypothetical protein ACPGRW_06290 [Flavobacteriaceae bacterium]